MGPSYQYKATIIRVVDGDSVWAEVDCGFHLRLRMSLRLAGINAPETSTAEGKVSRDYLKALLPPGTPVIVVTERDRTEKYGRFLATLYFADDPNTQAINQDLVVLGYAVPWDGKGARPGL